MPESNTSKNLQFIPDEPTREVEIQVAPLIDVVFLLICFYLLVSQLITTQKDPSVVLPLMENLAAVSEQPAEFVVNLRDDGAIVIGGRSVSLTAMRSLLSEQLVRSGKKNETLRVVVRADRRQRFGKLDNILRSTRNAGAKQIVFRARKGEEH